MPYGTLKGTLEGTLGPQNKAPPYFRLFSDFGSFKGTTWGAFLEVSDYEFSILTFG